MEKSPREARLEEIARLNKKTRSALLRQARRIVPRYVVDSTGRPWAAKDGPWVKHEDYTRLASEVMPLQAEVERLEKLVFEQSDVVGDLVAWVETRLPDETSGNFVVEPCGHPLTCCCNAEKADTDGL